MIPFRSPRDACCSWNPFRVRWATIWLKNTITGSVIPDKLFVDVQVTQN